MAYDPKDNPPVEYTLKNVSWHLKVISEEMKKLNAILEQLMNKSSQAPLDVRKAASNDLPF